MKRTPLALALVALTFALAPVSDALAHKVHRLAIHVDSADPKVQNLALNNVENLVAHYKRKGETIEIRVVTYGPGLHMFRSDTSKVKDRVERISLEMENVSFAACATTRRKMTKKEGKEIPIMPEAKMVPGGVIELMELQEKGWAYLRP